METTFLKRFVSVQMSEDPVPHLHGKSPAEPESHLDRVSKRQNCRREFPRGEGGVVVGTLSERDRAR